MGELGAERVGSRSRRARARHSAQSSQRERIDEDGDTRDDPPR